MESIKTKPVGRKTKTRNKPERKPKEKKNSVPGEKAFVILFQWAKKKQFFLVVPKYYMRSSSSMSINKMKIFFLSFTNPIIIED